VKVGIMQPYLFPYIGYFQLVAMVDTFVVHDDVQYIKGGWINRNRILVHGQPRYVTLPVRRGPSSLAINERVFADAFEADKGKVLRRIEDTYRKAPHFEAVLPLIMECLASTERNVSAFVVQALQACCRYLKIETPFVLSSDTVRFDDLKGQDRVLEINAFLGATHYINTIGGTELYDRDRFMRRGLKLSFLRLRPIAYRQFGGEYVENLSIVDVMMFNSVEQIASLLQEYDLEG
jgi:WbqC-like protein